MAVTTPDNLRTPNPGDPYNLVADLANLAQDVQDALNTKESNLLKGTSAQRVSFTSTATNGMLWQDTDSIKMIWRKDGAAWVPAIWQWSGTTTQMNGFTQAPNGFTWYNTSDNGVYVRVSGTWGSSSLQHIEFSSSTSIANSVDGTLGSLTLDATRSTNTSFVTSPSAGRIRLQPGIYAITLTADLPAPTTGLTLLGLRFPSSAYIARNNFPTGSSNGLMFSIASYRIMAANTDIDAYFFQTSGATRSVSGRVVVTKLG